MILTKNETSLKQFGLRLRSAREKQRLTQEDLVERLGKKTPTAISGYETGKRRLYAYELKDYADALELPVTYFFYGQLQADDEMEQALPPVSAPSPSSTASSNSSPSASSPRMPSPPSTPTGITPSSTPTAPSPAAPTNFD